MFKFRKMISYFKNQKSFMFLAVGPGFTKALLKISTLGPETIEVGPTTPVPVAESPPLGLGSTKVGLGTSIPILDDPMLMSGSGFAEARPKIPVPVPMPSFTMPRPQSIEGKLVSIEARPETWVPMFESMMLKSVIETRFRTLVLVSGSIKAGLDTSMPVPKSSRGPKPRLNGPGLGP